MRLLTSGYKSPPAKKMRVGNSYHVHKSHLSQPSPSLRINIYASTVHSSGGAVMFCRMLVRSGNTRPRGSSGAWRRGNKDGFSRSCL
jgi:hypothetical protein